MVAGPYGAIIGAVIGGVLGGLSYHPPKAPVLSKDKLDPVSSGQADFLDQSEHIGEVGKLINQANDYSNKSYQENVAKFAPETASTTGQIGKTGAALAGGNLPTGFLSAGPNGRQLNPADLGLTSDDLVKAGAGVVGQGENQAQALNPFNATATGTLLSPAALLQRRDAAGYYNTGLTNQALIGKSVAGAINPFASGVSTGLGSLSGSLRGLGQQGQGGQPSQYDEFTNPSDQSNYGFGVGDTGPTADSMFSASGDYTGAAADAAGGAADFAGGW